MEQITHCFLLNTFHSVRLTRSSLPVCETGNDSSVKQEIDLRLDTVLIQALCSLRFTEAVINDVAGVVDEFTYTIDLIRTSMN